MGERNDLFLMVLGSGPMFTDFARICLSDSFCHSECTVAVLRHSFRSGDLEMNLWAEPWSVSCSAQTFMVTPCSCELGHIVAEKGVTLPGDG